METIILLVFGACFMKVMAWGGGVPPHTIKSEYDDVPE